MKSSTWIVGGIAVFAVGAGLLTLTHQEPAAKAMSEPSSGTVCPFGEAAQTGHEHPHADGHVHVEGEQHEETYWGGLQDVNLTEAFTFSPERGETALLHYRLTEPARVQIRVKDAETRELFLATILNWDLREPGEHTEIWDGHDYSGNIIDMSRATITLIARKPEHGSELMPLDSRSPEEIVHSEEEHEHGTHHAWAEEVPYLRILEPAPRAESRGLLLIRSEVDENRRGYGDLYGYGVRYYVDGVLAREEFYKPESDGRFAYRLDTSAFPDGEHLLQIGMCDHHQHATSASVPVVFRNAAGNP